jgi:fructokinase
MNNEKKLKALSYGEVLWDVFGDEKKIGGAPLNVALRMKALGCDAAIISCVGTDPDGLALINQVKRLGLETNTIVTSEEFPTGMVQVSLDDKGVASYQIAYPSAWDKIVLNPMAKKLACQGDVLIYGSLVCRDSVSRLALEDLLENDIYKVFDVNLRKPHYSYAAIEKLMQSADFIKFNDQELVEIAAAMNSPFATLAENMEFIAGKTNSKAICVTKGKEGALLLWEGQVYQNGGYAVKVADTVGAGDSFLAALMVSLLGGEPAQTAIDFACAVGALVAQGVGANPEISCAEIAALIQRGPSFEYPWDNQV